MRDGLVFDSWAILAYAYDEPAADEVAALAKQRHAKLVTGDREFRHLESEIKIHWL